MKCSSCGNEINENLELCPTCGAKIEKNLEEAVTKEEPSNPSNPSNPEAPIVQPKTQDKKKPASKKKIIIPIIIVIVLLALFVFLILGIVVGILIYKSSKTINLNNYATVSFEGYDTVGTAHLDFDLDAFQEDYGNKLSYEGNQAIALMYYNDTDLFYDEYVGGNFDCSSDLSNGDVVTYTWNVNDIDIRDAFGYKVKYTDITATVEGLEEVETFDPFAELDVVFSGISPNGSVSLLNNSSNEWMAYANFTVSENSYLANKDVITVSLDTNKEYFINNYGKVPSPTQKEYTVEGLQSYVSSINQIPADVLEQFKTQASDVFSSYVANNWNLEVASLDSSNYLGAYFLTQKPQSSNSDDYYYSDFSNALYIVTKYTSSLNTDYDQKAVTVYYYVQFSNIIVNTDGTLSYDLLSYSVPSNEVNCEVKYGKASYQTRNYYYNGYNTLDELFSSCVTTYIDKYTYESTVSDITN